MGVGRVDERTHTWPLPTAATPPLEADRVRHVNDASSDSASHLPHRRRGGRVEGGTHTRVRCRPIILPPLLSSSSLSPSLSLSSLPAARALRFASTISSSGEVGRSTRVRDRAHDSGRLEHEARSSSSGSAAGEDGPRQPHQHPLLPPPPSPSPSPPAATAVGHGCPFLSVEQLHQRARAGLPLCGLSALSSVGPLCRGDGTRAEGPAQVEGGVAAAVAVTAIVIRWTLGADRDSPFPLGEGPLLAAAAAAAAAAPAVHSHSHSRCIQRLRRCLGDGVGSRSGGRPVR